MIIDIHTHIYPDRIAKRVVRQLGTAANYRAVCGATAAETRSKMIEWGVDKYVLLPVGTTPLCQSSNMFSAESADDMAIAFGTVHPAAADVEGEVERVAEMGLRGVKIHPQYQKTLISDDKYVRMIRRAARLNLPVLYHAGADPGNPPPCLALPDDTLKLLAKIEDIDNLVLIAAHMGGLYMYDDAESKLCGHNIYLDTAMVAETMPPEQCRRMIEKHGYERILFGSDCPWQGADTNLAYLRGLGLPKEQEDAILGGNAARILAISE